MTAQEIIVLGPPGCGKTYSVARWVRQAVEEHGPDNVLVTSFTRAAAEELGGRDLPIPPERLGTLHAICYRLLGQPPIAEAHARQWNSENGNPAWAIKGTTIAVEDADVAEGGGDGDELLQEVQRLRGQMIPENAWPQKLVNFNRVWKDWKDECGFQDFSDLIFNGMQQRPGGEIIFCDEAQDLVPSQYQLCKRWATDMQSVVFSGDDDQTLYSWLGANPEHLIRPELDAQHKRILSQSYRLPRAVHQYSQSLVSHISQREPKEFLPRDVEGSVTFETLTGKDTAELVAMAVDYTSHGEDLMFLATCSYLLDPIKNELRKSGVPFHNPYRPKRSDWSPLRSQARGSASTAERLAAFLDDEPPYWTANKIRSWVELIKVRGNLRPDYKQRLLELRNEVPITYETLLQIFEEYPLLCALARDVRWLREQALSSKVKALEYPTAVYLRNGLSGLIEQPKVILGTVHCSPPDEEILTSNGYVPIGDLDPSKHRLASYMKSCNRLTWGKHRSTRKVEGYGFSVAVNPYDGNLIRIDTQRSSTRVTPDHRVLARFSDKFMEKYVVYLMRRGDWWRIGLCVSAHRPYRSGGIAGRLSTEQADCGWVLGVYETRQEALIEESILQTEYGISGLTFEAAKNRIGTKEELFAIHERLKHNAAPRVAELLRDKGLLVDHPLYVRGVLNGDVRKRNMRGMFLTCAANLISEYMEVPVPNETFMEGKSTPHRPDYQECFISTEHYSGDVYSLEVLPHHYYISGGAVVHNSVKGGESSAVVILPELSAPAYESYIGSPAERDTILRTLYVGTTRAKRDLVLLSPSGRMAADWERYR